MSLMRLGPLFRILGTLIYGFIGWELGVALAGTREVTTQTILYLAPLAVIGGAIGYFLAPWLIIAPARAARDSLRSVPLEDLLSGTVGLLIGLLIALLISFPVSQIPPPFGTYLPFVGAVIFGYLGAAIMVVRKNDLFTIFGLKSTSKTSISELGVGDNGNPSSVLILDTSVIIDGRIADIAETGFILGKMVVPRFVLNELQHIADSSETLRRNRGRRGLEMLDRLKESPEATIEFVDLDPEDATQVDDKLVSLGRDLGGAVVTNDYNLNQVAKLQGVKILNINELANAVKSVVLPGEEMSIQIIQEGKERDQGIGYLDDGTMVVIENGRRFVNQEVLVQVTKILQTNAGRLIFATPDYT